MRLSKGHRKFGAGGGGEQGAKENKNIKTKDFAQFGALLRSAAALSLLFCCFCAVEIQIDFRKDAAELR